MRKIRKLYMAIALAMATMVVAAGAVFAAVTFDPTTGTGFVGKGDVQLALGYNNKQLQDNANSLVFTVSSETEQSWTCDRDAGPQTQERAGTTTTQGVSTSIAREKNQITGFNLNGYSGTPTTTYDGQGSEAGACPTNWTATNFQETPGASILYVNGVALQ